MHYKKNWPVYISWKLLQLFVTLKQQWKRILFCQALPISNKTLTFWIKWSAAKPSKFEFYSQRLFSEQRLLVDCGTFYHPQCSPPFFLSTIQMFSLFHEAWWLIPLWPSRRNLGKLQICSSSPSWCKMHCCLCVNSDFSACPLHYGAVRRNVAFIIKLIKKQTTQLNKDMLFCERRCS